MALSHKCRTVNAKLMIQNAHIARNDFVFQNCASRDIDSITVVCDDDDRALEE